MDRGAWWATIHGVAKSWAQLKQLSRKQQPRAAGLNMHLDIVGINIVAVGVSRSILPLLHTALCPDRPTIMDYIHWAP